MGLRNLIKPKQGIVAHNKRLMYEIQDHNGNWREATTLSTLFYINDTKYHNIYHGTLVRLGILEVVNPAAKCRVYRFTDKYQHLGNQGVTHSARLINLFYLDSFEEVMNILGLVKVTDTKKGLVNFIGT